MYVAEIHVYQQQAIWAIVSTENQEYMYTVLGFNTFYRLWLFDIPGYTIVCVVCDVTF